MDMAYRVLWVEDNDNWLRSNRELLRQVIEDEYDFRMVLTTAQGSQTMPAVELWRTFDIVLMDLNLVGEDGATLIDRLRKNEIYTDVVFYSAKGAQDVRRRAQELELDGVFCSSRDGNAFTDKVAAVVGNTVKKVQDVNNLRGLVTAEASDVARLFHDVVLSHQSALGDTEAADFARAFYQSLLEECESRLTALNKLAAASLPELLSSPHASDFQLWRQVVRIAEKAAGLQGEHITTIKQFQQQVQSPRNDLAHAIAEYDEARGLTTLRNRKKPDKVQEFTDAWCRDLRRTLRVHRTALSALAGLYAREDQSG